MQNCLRARRPTAVILAVSAAVVIGIVVWACTMPSSSDGLSMGDYGPEKQNEWAQRLVAGLNTHDVNKVPLLRANGVLSVEQSHTIEAVMPAPGCGYRLVSLNDRGEQPKQQGPGLTSEHSTYRFDMTVGEQCPQEEPRSRTLGVVAVAEMSYWEPYYFMP